MDSVVNQSSAEVGRALEKKKEADARTQKAAVKGHHAKKLSLGAAARVRPAPKTKGETLQCLHTQSCVQLS